MHNKIVNNLNELERLKKLFYFIKTFIYLI